MDRVRDARSRRLHPLRWAGTGAHDYNLGQAVQAVTCPLPYAYRWLLLA
ncbi:MAG TPA: hypothetical protein VMC09_15090 [Anaerolineales bacterium]|nr:hypothetical protein [Anaerolineales bacterium]